MQSKLFLIRHGETDFNRNHQMQGRGIDAPLNSTGFQQAEAVAHYLKNYQVDQVVSSSMLRAQQTANTIAELQGCGRISHDDLDEMNFGEFEGKNYYDIADKIEAVHSKWENGQTTYRIPGGESPVEVFERAGTRVMHYLREFDGDTIAFVIHGRLIRILLSVWTGLGLKYMHRIEHANGAINHLTWDSVGFEVIYLNKVDHLNEELRDA